MTIYLLGKRVALLEVRHAFLTILMLGALALLTINAYPDGTGDAQLAQALTISQDGRQISLAKGTSVHILNKRKDSATISLRLPDGSPLITQISLSNLEFSSAQSAPVSKSDTPPATQETTPSSTQDAASTPSSAEPTSSNNTPQAPSSVNLANTTDDAESAHPDFGTTLTPRDITLPPKRYTALHGFFYVVINGQPIPVVYSLPMENQHLAKSASNLVFYGPYPTEQTTLTGNIVPKIVENLGCSIFSLSFKQHGAELGDPKTAYWDKESPWFETIMSARDEIIKGFGLERKKLILMGYSGGGGMVLNLAGAFPDEVEAVAAGGANLAPETTEKNSLAWLILNNRGESNAAVTIPFYNRLQSLGCNALYCEATPDRRGRGGYHAPSQQIFDLIYSFIAAIVNQRDLDAKGVTDLPHLWPYASPKDPLKRYAIVKTSDLSEDELNGRTFDLLPSAAFALDWSKVCPPTQTVSPQDGSGALHVTFPATAKPIGTIIYFDPPNFENIARIVEDVSSLAEHGCVVISAAGHPTPEAFAHSAVNWIHSQGSYNKSSIHLLGYGAPGASFISTMTSGTDISVKSISLVDFDGSTIDDQLKSGIETAAKSCGMYGFFSYLDPSVSSSLTQLTDDLVTAESQKRGCCKVLVTRNMTPAILAADDTRLSTDADTINQDANKIALDNDKMTPQGQWESPMDQDNAEADQQQTQADRDQAVADGKQAVQDKRQAETDTKNAEWQAISMVKTLITKCNGY